MCVWDGKRAGKRGRKEGRKEGSRADGRKNEKWMMVFHVTIEFVVHSIRHFKAETK